VFCALLILPLFGMGGFGVTMAVFLCGSVGAWGGLCLAAMARRAVRAALPSFRGFPSCCVCLSLPLEARCLLCAAAAAAASAYVFVTFPDESPFAPLAEGGGDGMAGGGGGGEGAYNPYDQYAAPAVGMHVSQPPPGTADL
jgi:hypothetical protein